MWPTRFRLNKTGPGETTLMNIPMSKQAGTQQIDEARTQIRSSARFQVGILFGAVTTLEGSWNIFRTFIPQE